MKTKWFEVEVKAYKTVVVEVREDQTSDYESFEGVALRVARQDSFSFCDNVEACDCVEIPADRLESAKRHADEVF